MSRVIETALPGLPEELKYGSTRLRLMRAPSGDASDASAHGSAYRLATGYRYRMVMVDHCGDATYDLPPCHCVNDASGGRRCDEGRAIALSPSR